MIPIGRGQTAFYDSFTYSCGAGDPVRAPGDRKFTDAAARSTAAAGSNRTIFFTGAIVEGSIRRASDGVRARRDFVSFGERSSLAATRG